MNDLSRLQLVIESLDVVQATERLDRFEQSAGNAERGAQRFEQRGKMVARTTQTMSRSMDNLVKQLRALRTLFLTSVATTTLVRSFETVENGLVGVQKTTDLTDEALSRLEDRFQSFAVSAGVPAANILKLLETSGQLGVRGVENIALFGEQLAKLEAAAPSIAGGEAGLALARILNVTGEGPQEIEKLTNVIVRLGNETAALEGEIVRAAQFVGAISGPFNIASEEVVGLAASFVELGLRAETAASGLGRILTELTQAVDQGGERLRAFANVAGVLPAEFEAIANSSPLEAFLLVADGIGHATDRSQEGAQNIKDVLESLNLTGLESIRVFSALGANSATLRDRLGRAADEAENQTAANTEFARTNATLTASFTRLGNAALLAFSEFAGPVTGAAGALEGFNDTLSAVLAELVGIEQEGQETSRTIELIADSVRTLVAVGATFVTLSLAARLREIAVAAAGSVRGFGLLVTGVGTLATQFGDLDDALTSTAIAAIGIRLGRLAGSLDLVSTRATQARERLANIQNIRIGSIQQDLGTTTRGVQDARAEIARVRANTQLARSIGLTSEATLRARAASAARLRGLREVASQQLINLRNEEGLAQAKLLTTRAEIESLAASQRQIGALPENVRLRQLQRLMVLREQEKRQLDVLNSAELQSQRIKLANTRATIAATRAETAKLAVDRSAEGVAIRRNAIATQLRALRAQEQAQLAAQTGLTAQLTAAQTAAAASQGLLARSVRFTTRSFRALGAAIVANPIGALAVGISVILPFLSDFETSADRAAAAVQRLKEANEELQRIAESFGQLQARETTAVRIGDFEEAEEAVRGQAQRIQDALFEIDRRAQAALEGGDRSPFPVALVESLGLSDQQIDEFSENASRRVSSAVSDVFQRLSTAFRARPTTRDSVTFDAIIDEDTVRSGLERLVESFDFEGVPLNQLFDTAQLQEDSNFLTIVTRRIAQDLQQLRDIQQGNAQDRVLTLGGQQVQLSDNLAQTIERDLARVLQSITISLPEEGIVDALNQLLADAEQRLQGFEQEFQNRRGNRETFTDDQLTQQDNLDQLRQRLALEEELQRLGENDQSLLRLRREAEAIATLTGLTEEQQESRIQDILSIQRTIQAIIDEREAREELLETQREAREELGDFLRDLERETRAIGLQREEKERLEEVERALATAREAGIINPAAIVALVSFVEREVEARQAAKRAADEQTASIRDLQRAREQEIRSIEQLEGSVENAQSQNQLSVFDIGGLQEIGRAVQAVEEFQEKSRELAAQLTINRRAALDLAETDAEANRIRQESVEALERITEAQRRFTTAQFEAVQRSAGQGLIQSAVDLQNEFNALFRTERENQVAQGLAEIEERATLARAALETSAEFGLVNPAELAEGLSQIDTFATAARERLNDLADVQLIRQAAGDISRAFGDSLRDVISEVRSAEEAFEQFSLRLGSILLERIVINPIIDTLTASLTGIISSILGIGTTSSATILTTAGVTTGTAIFSGAQAAGLALISSAQIAAALLAAANPIGAAAGGIAGAFGGIAGGAAGAGAGAGLGAVAGFARGGVFEDTVRAFNRGGILDESIVPLQRGGVIDDLKVRAFARGGVVTQDPVETFNTGGILKQAMAERQRVKALLRGGALDDGVETLVRGGIIPMRRGQVTPMRRGDLNDNKYRKNVVAAARGGTIAPASVIAMATGRTLGRGMSATVATQKSVRALLSGSIISQPTLVPQALIGEGARPEAVMPLDKTTQGDLGVMAAINTGNGVVKTTLALDRLQGGNLGVRLDLRDIQRERVEPMQRGGVMESSVNRFSAGSGSVVQSGGTSQSTVINNDNRKIDFNVRANDPNKFRGSQNQALAFLRRT